MAWTPSKPSSRMIPGRGRPRRERNEQVAETIGATHSHAGERLDRLVALPGTIALSARAHPLGKSEPRALAQVKHSGGVETSQRFREATRDPRPIATQAGQAGDQY